MGMANIKTIFSEVVMSSRFFSARSFGYNAKAKKEEYVITVATCVARPYLPLAPSPP